MHPDQDLDLELGLPAKAAALTQDLELTILLADMAAGDRYVYDVATRVVLTSLEDADAIRYRQGILADCLSHPAVARELYAIAVEAIERERRVWGGGGLSRLPDSLLRRSVDVVELFVGSLKRLRDVAKEHASDFASEGFARFFAMVAAELNDDYLQTVQEHLKRLRFNGGVPVSANLGAGNRGKNYVLRRRDRASGWRARLGLPDSQSYVYQLPERDEAGADILRELRGRGLSLAANALGQSTDHILNFFRQLRAELAFYVGCLNAYERLVQIGEPICLPVPTAAGSPTLSCLGLYDICLSLGMADRIVGNDVNAVDKALVLITGANRGGKSTFLRSIGLAQLMMQCGMFVAAEAFTADTCHGLFTHFKREEDASLGSGKLDEELSRMSSIVDQVTRGSLVLLNESFASTNEREGSEIGRQIVRALIESGVKVFYVTHMFDLAHGFWVDREANALFLRAERLPDGTRTFRLEQGEPLPTSYGVDVYRRVFGAVAGASE